MIRCEACLTDFGRVREGYAHRLPDGQRVALCLTCATRWRLSDPSFSPVPFGAVARAAVAAVAIVGVTA